MEYEQLKIIYHNISELLECHDDNDFPKILKDNIPVYILNRNIKIFDFEYGYFSDIRLGDFITNEIDSFHDIYGVNLFYYINYIFREVFIDPKNDNFEVNKFVEYNDYDLDFVIDENVELFLKECSSLKDKIFAYNINDEITSKLTYDELKTFNNGIDNIGKIISNCFDANNILAEELKRLIKKSKVRIENLNDELDKELSNIHELERQLNEL